MQHSFRSIKKHCIPVVAISLALETDTIKKPEKVLKTVRQHMCEVYNSNVRSLSNRIENSRCRW